MAFRSRLRTTDGTSYQAQAWGDQRDDGKWEGWIEFVPDDASPAIRTDRETTQPNLTALEYWATGLRPVYLQGAFERTSLVP